MKLKDVAVALGYRSSPKVYGYEIEPVDIGEYGRFEFAHWQHPRCRDTAFDPAWVTELAKYLSSGDAVIDVGAHTGDTAFLFALAVGAEGKVFAVEPNRYVLPTLRRNATLNPAIASIEVLPYAATTETAKLVFQYSDPGYCNGGDLDQFGRFRHGHFYPLEVEGRNIAELLRQSNGKWLPKVRLIKTDTEGNDLAVIESFRDFIATARPFVVAEMYKRTSDIDRKKLLSLLVDLGYDLYRAELWTRLKAESIGVDDASRWEHFDVFAVPSKQL